MSKSQVVLIVLIAGVVWLSKDYLFSKKDMVISQVNEIRSSQAQDNTSPSLKEFEH
ncbi:MAG: hypothetical protein R3208_21195 [Ketobacteraceae bacterium]|nr:hypothetical protein [Ketobacteraceae bacterium]